MVPVTTAMPLLSVDRSPRPSTSEQQKHHNRIPSHPSTRHRLRQQAHPPSQVSDSHSSRQLQPPAILSASHSRQLRANHPSPDLGRLRLHQRTHHRSQDSGRPRLHRQRAHQLSQVSVSHNPPPQPPAIRLASNSQRLRIQLLFPDLASQSPSPQARIPSPDSPHRITAAPTPLQLHRNPTLHSNHFSATSTRQSPSLRSRVAACLPELVSSRNKTARATCLPGSISHKPSHRKQTHSQA